MDVHVLLDGATPECCPLRAEEREKEAGRMARLGTCLQRIRCARLDTYGKERNSAARGVAYLLFDAEEPAPMV